MSTFEEQIRALESDPLFHMSLGSSELFHTNFLAWIIKKYPAQSMRLLGISPSDRTGKKDIVEREKDNFDLRVVFEGHPPIIIENKVKSYPNLAQLDEYEEKIRSKTGREAQKPYLVLLSLFPKPWKGEFYKNKKNDNEKEFYEWTYLGYETLANRLLEMCEGLLKTGDDGFNHRLISRYAEFVTNLVAFARYAALSDKEDYFQVNRLEEIQEKRIASLYTKLRAAELADLIREDIEELLKEKGFSKQSGALHFIPNGTNNEFKSFTGALDRKPLLFQVNAEYTHGEPIVTMKFCVPEVKALLGVQLQGKKLRLFAITDESLNKSFREKIASDLEVSPKHGWFNFETAPNELVKKLKPNEKGKEQNTWGTFAPSFIYKKRDIEPGDDVITVALLRELFKDYAKVLISMAEPKGHAS